LRLGDVAHGQSYLANSREAFSLAAQALDASLKVNPYYRETLIFRANTALGLHDSVTALVMSRRLLAVDPMNKTGIKIMAYAQQQNGKIDSALYYYKLATRSWSGYRGEPVRFDGHGPRGEGRRDEHP